MIGSLSRTTVCWKGDWGSSMFFIIWIWFGGFWLRMDRHVFEVESISLYLGQLLALTMGQLWFQPCSTQMLVRILSSFGGQGPVGGGYWSAELPRIWVTTDNLSVEEERDESHLYSPSRGDCCGDKQLEYWFRSCVAAREKKRGVRKWSFKEVFKGWDTGGGSLWWNVCNSKGFHVATENTEELLKARWIGSVLKSPWMGW